VLLPWLTRLRKEDPRDRVLYAVWKKELQGASLRELVLWTQFGEGETLGILQGLAREGELVEADPEQQAYLSRDAFRSLQESVLEQIRLYHEKNPLQSGMPKEAVGTGGRHPVPERFLVFTLTRLSEQGDIVVDRDRVRISSHRVRLSDKDQGLCGKIRQTLREKGVMPPTVKELCEQIGCSEQEIHPLLDYLTNEKELVKVSEALYFASDVIEALKNRLVDYLQQNAEILAGDFKTLSQTTRKYTIPLMEYFDRTRLTLRLGDRRVLREKKSQPPADRGSPA